MTITADATTYAGAASATNATSYTTASQTPVAGDRVLVVVGSAHSSLVPNQPTITGNGQTWTAVGTAQTGIVRATMFSCLVASPSAGTCAIDFAGQTQQRCIWSFVGFRSDAGTITIGTVATNTGNPGNTASVTPTDPGGGDGVHAGIYKADTGAYTKDTNYTLADEASAGAEASRLQTQYLINSVSDLTANWSWTTSVQHAEVGVVLLEPSGPFNVTPTGLAQSVTFGTASVLFLTPTGFSSTATFGTAALSFSVAPVGLEVTATFGTPTLTTSLAASGLDQTVAFGTPALSFSEAPVGFDQTVAFGTPALTIPVNLVVTALGTIQSTTNATSYNTTTHGAGAIAATATGAAVFAVVSAVRASGTPPTPTLINHSALPFSLLTATTGTNPTTATLATNPDLVGVWGCLSTGTTSDDVDVSFGSTTMAGCLVSFFEITGFATPPAAIADTIVQLELATFTTATTATVTLNAFADADNVAVLAVGALNLFTVENLVPEAGATEIHDLGHGSPDRGLLTAWEKNDTDPTATWTNTSAGIALALEINASGTPPALTVTPTGLAVTATFGQPTVLFLTPAGLEVTATFGAASLTFGSADLTPTGFAVTPTFGTPALTFIEDSGFFTRDFGGAVAATPTTATITGTLTGGGVLWVIIGTRGTATVPTPTVASPGTTFTLAVTQARPEDDRRVSVFWSNDYDAGVDMELTITHGSAPTAVAWAAVEQFGVLVTGNPVAQSNGTANTSGTTPSTTLTAGTGEMLVAVVWASGSITATPPGAGVELFDFVSATTGIAGYWDTAVPAAPTITLSSASSTAIVAIETIPTPVSFDVTPSGFTVTATFGAASLSLLVHVTPAGFEQPVVFGQPTLTIPLQVTPTGLPVPVVFGAPTLVFVVGLNLNPTGLTVTVVFGAPATTGLDDLPAIAITARLDAMFYRNTTKLGLALVPLGNTQPLGFRRSETWQRVSSRFVMNQGTHDAVMALMPAVWSSHSAATQTELTTAINMKLQDAGYRAPGGFDLT